MNATLLESHITAATAALGRNRTPSNGSGDRSGIAPETNRKEVWSTWAADYGHRNETTAKAALAAARLPIDGSGGDYSASGDIRKNRLGNGYIRHHKAVWRQVASSICPGTRNFLMLASFAVVLLAT